VRFDLQTRTTYALLFGMFGLFIMLIGSMLNLPVSEVLAGIFGSIVLGAIGVEAARTKWGNGNGSAVPDDQPRSSGTTPPAPDPAPEVRDQQLGGTRRVEGAEEG
jgi:hypothetical protein